MDFVLSSKQLVTEVLQKNTHQNGQSNFSTMTRLIENHSSAKTHRRRKKREVCISISLFLALLFGNFQRKNHGDLFILKNGFRWTPFLWSISNLKFAGYTGSRPKMEFVGIHLWKSIFQKSSADQLGNYLIWDKDSKENIMELFS